MLGKAGQAANTVKDLSKLIKPRDKACKNVKPKVIAIGEHTVAQPNTATVQAQANGSPSPSAVPAVTADKKTIINITGMDFEKLTALEQNIKACAIVKSTVKKFNNPQSTIEVTHTGTTEELLNLMFQTCKNNFKKNNLTQQEEGLIALKL